MSIPHVEVPPQSRDEDVTGAKKSKQRQPKSREKWSLLWFIPPTVLNDREISSDGKKGKRHGFDRFNYLSCKVCHTTFHNSQVLSIHKAEAHQGSLVPPRISPSPSPSSRSRSSMASFSGSVRRSSRRSHNNSINYCDDDDIEILDGPSYSHSTRTSRNKTSEVEEVCIDDDDSIEEVAVEPDMPIMMDTPSIEITRVTDNEDEILLMDDTPEDEEDEIEILENNKRKQSPHMSQANKKTKAADPLEMDDVVEIQSSSGKSMFVKKSLLNKVGLSPPSSRFRSLGL